MVQSNPLLHPVHDSVPYKNTLEEGLKPNADWRSEFFYVNSFFSKDDMPTKKNSSQLIIYD